MMSPIDLRVVVGGTSLGASTIAVADVGLETPEELAHCKRLPQPLPGLLLGHERLRVAQRELRVGRLTVESLRQRAHVSLQSGLRRRDLQGDVGAGG